MTKKFNIPLPEDAAIERSVIQNLFRRPQSWYDVARVLMPQAFFSLLHRDVYAAFVAIMELGETPSLYLVRDRLMAKPIWAEKGEAGLTAEISKLITGIPIGTLGPNCAGLLDLHFRREIMVMCERGYLQAAKSKAGLDIAHSLSQDVSALLTGVSGPTEMLSWEQGEELIKWLQQVQQDKQQRGMTGKTTGSKVLDEEVGGMQDCDLIIVAAKTNIGKTPFMIQMGEEAAAQTGLPTAYFTLEVDNRKIFLKMLARASGVPMKEMITGNIAESGWEAISGRGMTRYLSKKMICEDTPGISIEDLKTRARALRAKYNIGCIVVDYLQLMSCRAKKGNREQEINHIAQELKNLAKELHIPVVAGSQLNRAVSLDKAQVPQLHHLRDSGNVEQAADMIFFLYRPELYEIHDIVVRGRTIETHGITLVITAKHRPGFARIGVEWAVPMMYQIPERYVDYTPTDYIYNSPHND